MTYAIEWEDGAVESLKRLPSWQDAARVARNVMEFARTGQGELRRVGEGQEYRLYVRPYVVRMGIDTSARVIRVWTVFVRR